MYQHALPPDCGWDCVAAALLDLRLTSTMSSCFVEESVSIPGKAAAIFQNSAWQQQEAYIRGFFNFYFFSGKEIIICCHCVN